MNSDIQMQHHVQAELEREPSIDASQIGVTARDGVVTLTGCVGELAERVTAEEVAKRVHGVQAVANDVEVRLPETIQPTDADVATAGLNSLRRYLSLLEDRVKVTVSNGWTTLEGTVDSQCQKDVAYHAVRLLAGVRGVTNHLVVTPKVEPEEVRDRIEAAFKRHAELDARTIGVDVQDGTVALQGNVRSWEEREEAEQAARAVPGVSRVENHLGVIPQPEPLEACSRP